MIYITPPESNIKVVCTANWVIIYHRSHLLREPETTIDNIYKCSNGTFSIATFVYQWRLLPVCCQQRICKKSASKKKCSWKNSLSPPSRIQVANFPALPKNQQKKARHKRTSDSFQACFQTGSIFKNFLI